MQLWPEPERGPQRSPLKASSEVCTGFLRCTPLGLEKGSGFCKQMHAVSSVQCSGVQKGNRESHSAIDIKQLWCAFYRLCAFECCAFELNPRYATVLCTCRVRWTVSKCRAIGRFNAVDRCARLQWAANLRGNADAAVSTDQLSTCRDLCENCICPNCIKYSSTKFQKVFVQV